MTSLRTTDTLQNHLNTYHSKYSFPGASTRKPSPSPLSLLDHGPPTLPWFFQRADIDPTFSLPWQAHATDGDDYDRPQDG
eukprot:CAMPEP_0203783026 /NCGR_PEP_ID=MMETSP0099_2-20121227/11432_1 /ASSEMBLY_ACC=CAM_ASM_000209 /TAXON_ID=96639 /ORGANISM=" , Strain NY0313808BC1" /LENGTH=79 /DNA_ID=CAMNT_0050684817 /DNA_START=279 /DNA_END=519 /DNA_ORIENTATION=-